MQRLDTLVVGLVSGSLSVAPLLSIPTVSINLYDDLSLVTRCYLIRRVHNGGMLSFIAYFISKYQESHRLLPRHQPFRPYTW
ncbi:hypothetical protein DFJ58DRAFT_795895 [Suillus subalutaceus]|uniref:uncharacterized protein n=1 Tax=Suillus subalutaceus TaxID=48586 RepID=UPI001B864ED8|nr:uncharacterized protein DFJ58DRAFT_795895 [Suillus subalutaceus]KAG1848730.1 hypothetical protein DFJ58DRAFT_795895 [Suillus subalutaceus]